jgi:TatD DNase family protein
MAGAVDSHTHLNHPRLLRRLDEVLARAKQAGVSAMVVVGYDLPSSELAVELSEANPNLWAAVGIHPHDASHLDDSSLAHLRSLASRERVVAIGETGLDFHRDLSPPDAQVEAFRRQLDLARETSLPALLHCREAQEQMLDIAAEFASVPAVGGFAAGTRAALVWHCFEGTDEHAARAVALGMMVGFTGTITRKSEEAVSPAGAGRPAARSAAELRQIAAGIPADRLLLETDCPYLSPEPGRQRDNEPANVIAVAEHLAAARGVAVDAVIRVTTDNARRVLGVGVSDG